MHHAFISVITVLQAPRDIRVLSQWLTGLYEVLNTHFSDFEFILVNNHCEQSLIDTALRPLPEALRQHVFLLNLSAPVSRDNALMAGLDRANGDYTAVFELDFADQPELLLALWEKTQAQFDIAYLRARERQL